jgi:hypothetical protein
LSAPEQMTMGTAAFRFKQHKQDIIYPLRKVYSKPFRVSSIAESNLKRTEDRINVMQITKTVDEFVQADYVIDFYETK